MALTIPPEPAELRADRPPPGYRVKLATFNDKRRFITPRLQLAHTNGAKGEGSIESSWSWMQRNTGPGCLYGNPQGSTYFTIPHFQLDRDGDSAMLLELNRQGIASAKANSFCISYETADRGYGTDPYPTGSQFTGAQLQMLATGFAYCSMLFKIPLEYPTSWNGSGSASHTEPFGYPYWTTAVGKPCPGNIKKEQVRDVVLPHARAIVAAWTGTTPAPKPIPPPPTPTTPITPIRGGDEMILMMRYGGTASSGWGGWASLNGGVSRRSVTGPQADAFFRGEAYDGKTLAKVTSWGQVTWTNDADELAKYLG